MRRLPGEARPSTVVDIEFLPPPHTTGSQEEIERPHLHPLKDDMGRRQNKISLNNRKTNMTPPESRDSTPARPEKLDTKDKEEMDLKNYLSKMIETFKEETRKSLKEIEEKANKKLYEMEEKDKPKNSRNKQIS
ncbi:hypothetical protein ACM6QF_13245 [Enterococcus faecium]|uniref:hypothetical protein n=1 Tax=Enterococcus faecium TaxID=1352 RepID=UPI0039FBA53E